MPCEATLKRDLRVRLAGLYVRGGMLVGSD
jgi:hypothetical protein